MIKGIDEEDRTREQEMLTLGEALKADRQRLKDDVAKEILNEVDLSYYYLTNDAFFNVLPVIEVNYFLTIQTLNVSGNVLDDEAIRAICDSLIMSHNLTIQKLLMNDTGCGNYGITTIIETMRCIHKLCTVEVQNCKNISKVSLDKLNAALRINQAREEKTQ